mmetsp:Transcript_116168/g.339757  ORF Transcript_116168/g.339757 Transcript_116168/m.339757 type:complete len:996 (+) Transcript_116168:60-3047(+)
MDFDDLDDLDPVDEIDPSTEEREYGIILYGATGYVGQLMAEHLDAILSLPDSKPLRWALAGRNKDKLRRVARNCKSTPALIVADDPVEISKMAGQCRVLLSAAGPFSELGEDVVRACVNQVTHYVDVATELPWVHSMVSRHHEKAKEKGAMIVLCAGAVCAVDELLCYSLAKHLGPLKQYRQYGCSAGADLSGGGYNALLATAQSLTSEVAESVLDPFSLGGRPGVNGGNVREGLEAIQDTLLPSLWLTPAQPGILAERVLRRTCSLFEERSAEGMSYGSGLSITVRDWNANHGEAEWRITQSCPLLTAEHASAMVSHLQAARKEDKLPVSGAGPTSAARARNSMEIWGVAEGENGQWANARYSSGDAFEATAMAAVAGAMVLVQELEIVRPKERAGVLTPAMAFHGSTWIERLKAHAFAASAGRRVAVDIREGQLTVMELLKVGNISFSDEEVARDGRPRWVMESAKKMQALRDGLKILPPEAKLPVRLQGSEAMYMQMLPPFKRLDHKGMQEMCLKSLPGHFSGMKFPHTSEQLEAFGPEWYTQAFHKFGTLPKDNKVTKVVSVEQLPHSGFDAAGGAGHKAFVTLEYERPDPDLHTKLFAKFPWDYFESETGKAYRMQLSTYGDMDSFELMTSIFCEHLLPFRIPKLYFCDINRDTTNYVLIVERIPFGKRGKLENGRVVEDAQQKPFEVLPACGKYQDYLLSDPAKIYYCIFREMAHLAAWDHLGRYDSFLGPMNKFTTEQWLAATGPRKAQSHNKYDAARRAIALITDKGIEFATKVAPQVFTPVGKDLKMLQRMKEDFIEISPYAEDIGAFIGSSSDYIAAMHLNLQADNAFFWPDDHGELDCGVFDWCGFGRVSFVMNFMGCLSGAEAEMLDAHEEGLMTTFCQEYERYGGPHIEPEDLLLRYRLQWPLYAMDSSQYVERDIYRECPKEEWASITSKMDSKFIDRWNVRCRGTTLINCFEYWPRRKFRQVFESWKSGVGKAFITPFNK